MKTAGLDIGTTGCKLTVFSEEGKDIDRAYRDYNVVNLSHSCSFLHSRKKFKKFNKNT